MVRENKPWSTLGFLVILDYLLNKCCLSAPFALATQSFYAP